MPGGEHVDLSDVDDVGGLRCVVPDRLLFDLDVGARADLCALIAFCEMLMFHVAT